jgi:hypothetical protein
MQLKCVHDHKIIDGMCIKYMTDLTPLKRKKRGFAGSEKQFPGKLHDMLDHLEKEAFDDTVSWTEDGRGFTVNDSRKLLEIIPLFFGHNKYRSFQRQLNFWSFQRILKGPNKGALMHPYFIRGRKDLCKMISRPQFRAQSLKETSEGFLEEKETKKRESSGRQGVLFKDDQAPKGRTAKDQRVPSSLKRYFDTRGSEDRLKDGDRVDFAGKQFHFLDVDSKPL